MSNLRQLFPLDHPVFSGGRYLRAFDHLADIDHYEHSILTYIGSLLPFDKGFLDHPAFPSIATISRSTKISESTVRKKLRSLEKKGYVKVKAVRALNYQGKYQQSSNDYYLAPIAFEFFQDVMESRKHIQSIRKRAVGDSFDGHTYPIVSYSPPSQPENGEAVLEQTAPMFQTAPNSLPKVPDENPDSPDSFSGRDIFTMKGEVDRIVVAWEELVKIPVSKGEKERFLKEYIRIRGNEIFYMERLLVITSDPYITSRAKSICFLFSGLDCALKNKAEIVEKAGLALMKAQSERELGQVLDEIPEFINKKSRNFGGSSEEVIRHLLQDPINKAKKRLGIDPDFNLPTDERGLRSEVERLLQTDLNDQLKCQLKSILEALPRLSFGYCLGLFARLSARLKAEVTP
ncbi:MAG TPA: helix-turn-helix domain-containing protein [Oligoflexus sp.]|uniref:helix-turn-helix domain-containing protein n=1 Tax=Oligoflexus sp. TaxID=1971216 RepID=UPI002D7EB803|nr:helix-turn-helix domain-containing protein [Oligoflexus sp.]HET9241541.1 helix-turn-helix domain-containing protein [Oligoflexus sp.]